MSLNKTEAALKFLEECAGDAGVLDAAEEVLVEARAEIEDLRLAMRAIRDEVRKPGSVDEATLADAGETLDAAMEGR